MLPAVDLRSPAMITPSSKASATMVVPCGRSAAAAAEPAAARALAPGRSSGANEARKSAKDEVPAFMYAAENRPPKKSEPTRILPIMRIRCLSRPYCRDSQHQARGPARCCQPTANPPGPGLLAALLNVGPDELLGVLLEYLVDLVEDRVHVISELVLALLDVLIRLRRRRLPQLADTRNM